MIRKEAFTPDADTFAAKRKGLLSSTDERLLPHVKDALRRVGLPSWQAPIVRAATEVFEEVASTESDGLTQQIDALRNEFQRELSEALEKTKKVDRDRFDQQADRITKWISTMSINAATEAATSTDPDPLVGLEWVTMQDKKVRDAHQEAHGQQTVTGKPFEVGGEELLYPGQPVGDPANWMNCRCVARPAMLGEMATSSITASVSAAADPDEAHTSAVIVALPALNDPVTASSSEQDGAHCTLLFLGETGSFDPETIKAELEAYTSAFTSGPVTDGVMGTAVLGDDSADVVLLEAANLANIRGAILASDAVRAVHDGVEQFPAWIPHVTLGYPETPATTEYTGESMTFDRLALWDGEDRTEYALGGKPEEQVIVAAVEPLEQSGPVVSEEEPELIPDEEAAIQVMFHGVAAPEGVMSGDGRGFAIGALTNRPLPIPMKAMFIDDEGHKGSAIAGRIDKLWKEDNLLKYEGVFDMSEAGYESIRLIADQMWSGVSVDLDQAVGTATKDGKGIMFSEGRVSAVTICAIPAFAEAFIALGPSPEPIVSPVITGEAGADTEEFAPETVPVKTKDGPGWVTNPEPTKEITSYWVTGLGRAKIGWGAPGDFNRCRVQLAKYVQNPEWLAGLCANLHYRALGTWPGRNTHAGETVDMQMDEKAELPSVTLTASAALEAISADFFRKMEFSGPTPMTITDDGHIFGHLAQWDTCHIGKQPCVSPPRSQTNYAYFLTGEYLTDAGRVPVGQITLGDGGHAPDKMGMRGAMSHYDNTGAAVADITVWDDEHGIGFSGKLREDLSQKTLRVLMASPLSGDWRGVLVNGSESLEMCAALAVNVQGFAIPRVSYAMEGDRQLSLVAAGALEPRPLISAEFEAQMAEYNARHDRRVRLAAIREKNRVYRLETVKAQIEKVQGK